MSSNTQHASTSSSPGGLRRRLLLLAGLFVLALGVPSMGRADDSKDAEDSLLRLASKYVDQGFDFRADIWERELTPSMGKAVRVQMFKGNDYRVCVAVPSKSGVSVTAKLLDGEGKTVEAKTEVSEGGWGLTLVVKPKRTGVYVVAIRQADGNSSKAVTCAMIMGYK